MRDLVGRAAISLYERARGAGLKDWISGIGLLLIVTLWIVPRPPQEHTVDLAVTSVSFDSADTWDWTTLGCTVGPRVRVLAHVKNLGNVPMEDGDARVRFVGKPAASTDADVLTVEVPLTSIGTSRRTDEATVGPTVTLPEAFLTRHSSWTATVIHPDDVNPKNDVVKEQILNPCRQHSDMP